MSDPKVGVFLCDCGDRIASILDMDALLEGVRGLPGVAVARRLRYSCSKDGLAAIKAFVREQGLNRLVVAGCTPRTLEPRFQALCREVGLDRGYFQIVDIREGCAWVHQSDGEAATAKAISLVRMGIAKVGLSQKSARSTCELVPSVLVIGGGVAGMTAAVTVAEGHVPVTLVEREAALGGMLRRLNTVFPDRSDAMELVAGRADAVARHPDIGVLTESEVKSVSGTVGRYSVTVGGCTDGEQGSSTFTVGAIIVATGARAQSLRELPGSHGENVVTQLGLERMLREAREGGEPGKSPTDVVVILGAERRRGAGLHCSAVNSMTAVRQSLDMKAADPLSRITILFRDLCTPDEIAGPESILQAKQAGVEFVRYDPESPPEVSEGEVVVKDATTGLVRRIPCDLAVVSPPMVPQADASVLAHVLGISQDEDGFFPEKRYRLRPKECVERGIFICGSAHHPTDWFNAELQAIGAAFNAVRYLKSGETTTQAPVAVVNEELCTGCGTCVGVCSFGAISIEKRDGVLDLSRIDPYLCKGCGNCVTACPAKAIAQPVDSDTQILTQIDAALAGPRADGQLRILGLVCEWSGNAAAELAGARKMNYSPEVLLIPVRCSGRFDPTHVLWALFSGADGVFLGACPPGECHYGSCNQYAQRRIGALQELVAENGFDSRRLRLEWITPDDAGDFVDKISDFTSLIRAIGPNPVRDE